MAEEETGQLGLETELAGAEVKCVTEKRVGKLTHKALLEKISILEKERKSNFGKLSKVKHSILKFMGDKEHVNKVENELTVFNELCNTIQQVHASLLGLLPAEEASKHEIWYQAKMLNVKEFLVGTNQWLSDTAACPATKVGDDHDDEVNDDLLGQTEQSQTVQSENEIGPQDSISNVQSRHHGSNRSSSSRFSTSSARRRAEAERAALLARAAALKAKHALEEQELLLRRKREKLELDTEIAATSAKLAVLQMGSSIHSRQSDGMASYFRKGARSKLTSLNPQASIYVAPPTQQRESLPQQCNAETSIVSASLSMHFASQPQPTVSHGSQLPHLQSMPTFSQSFQPTLGQQVQQPLQDQNQTAGLYNLLQQQNDITARLVQMQTSHLLPRREIPTYDGDPLQFNTFMRAFEHCVEAKTGCKGDCLYYLEQFTRGQPRDIVRSCLHMTADKGFAVAKRLLKEHFGNEFKITAAYMEKVTGWPSIKAEDTKALKAYGLFLCECSNAMEDLQYLEELNMPANMKILSQKLPYKLRDKWRAKACDVLEKTGRRARFSDLVKFIERQVRIISDPVFGDIQDTSPVLKGATKVSKIQVTPQLWGRNSFATQVVIEDGYKADTHRNEDGCSRPDGDQREKALGKVTTFTKTTSVFCQYCAAGGHVLDQCFKLGRKPHREKLDYLKEKVLCFSCLCTGHLSRNCDRRITCKKCNRTHPSVLRIEEKERVSSKDEKNSERSKTSESRTTSSACGLTGAGHCNGILPILPVKVKCAKGNRVIETYAFLDPGSTGTFCTRKLVDRLNMEGCKCKIHIRTLGHNNSIESSIVDSLEISGFSGESFYPLPKVFTQKEMPVSTANIISERELRKWHYLDNVNIQHINADVDLLIGTNASKLMEPWEVINSREGEDGPYAIRTLLGWVINGPLGGSDDCGSDHPSFCANRIAIDHIEELLISQYNYDFNDRASAEQEEMSREENKFMEKMESSAQLQNGHYTFQLPFKGKNVLMPNNLRVAVQRVRGLRRRIQKDVSFHEKYKNFLADVISNGYAEEVPQHQLEAPTGKVWYIPHHGVYHPRKGKLRVVFDCGAEYKGISLNSQLLQRLHEAEEQNRNLVAEIGRLKEELLEREAWLKQQQVAMVSLEKQTLVQQEEVVRMEQCSAVQAPRPETTDQRDEDGESLESLKEKLTEVKNEKLKIHKDFTRLQKDFRSLRRENEQDLEHLKKELAEESDKNLKLELEDLEIKQNYSLKQLMRDFNTQMALKEKEIELTVKETIGKAQCVEAELITSNREEVSQLHKLIAQKDDDLQRTVQKYEQVLQSREDEMGDRVWQVQKELEDLQTRVGGADSEMSIEDLQAQLSERNTLLSEARLKEQEFVDRIHSLEDTMRCLHKKAVVTHLGNPCKDPGYSSTDALSEPTEFEYLRKVLFEYMMGRETKTMAKVLTSVLKFPPEQVQSVLEKEESKALPWLR